MPEQSLKEKTAKGLLWGAINNGAQQLLVLVFGIILGRILGPEEYGMVGMLTVFTLIGNSLQESGFRAALVNVKNIRHEDYNFGAVCSSVHVPICFFSFVRRSLPDFIRNPNLLRWHAIAFLPFPLPASAQHKELIFSAT